MDSRPEDHQTGQAPPRGSFALLMLAMLAVCLLAGLLLNKETAQTRLARAARAVLPPVAESGRNAVVQLEGRAFVLPVRPEFDHAEAIRLALRLEAMSAKELRTQAGESAYASLGTELADLLRVDEARARVVLHALGLAATESRLALRTVSEEARVFAEHADAWPEAAEALERDFGLSERTVQALRGELCRFSLERAFDSRRSLREARDALAKHADLIPGQADAVLAMAGALKLRAAGSEANAALRIVERKRPDLADLLSRER